MEKSCLEVAWPPLLMLLLLLSRAAGAPFSGDEQRELLQKIQQAKKMIYGDGKYNELDEYGREYLTHRGDSQLPALVADAAWPRDELELGQAVGVAAGRDGQVTVLHRAERVWDEDSFNEENMFLNRNAINGSCLLRLDEADGTVKKRWGSDLFFMPHGLTIDDSGSMWVTDVALHQVMRFRPGEEKPSLTLGEAFVPAFSNEDREHFCKPTDVAVSSSGNAIFVADGYCNSRVVRYDSSGNFVSQIGDLDLWVPHAIALAEDLDRLCVADRDKERILCFDAGLKNADNFGENVHEIGEENLGRIFGVAYSSAGNLLHAVSGPTNSVLTPGGFTFELGGGDNDDEHTDVASTWSPEGKGFESPHAVAVSPSGSAVYVVELDPPRVWKFNRKST